MYRESSISGIADVMKKGSGSQLILGLIILIIGIGIGLSLRNVLITYLTIDAILRYKIIEDRSKDALLNVENFNEMIQQVSQTTLRNNIGSAFFQEILSKRVDINNLIKSVIAQEASNWGIEVTGVEIRQVIIPQELENAMSMQAQAEREKNARVIY